MAWKTFWMSSGLFVLGLAYKIKNMVKIELPGGMTVEKLRGLTVEQVLDYGYLSTPSPQPYPAPLDRF